MKYIINQEEIKTIIPHRDPFLFLDGITQLEVNKSITAHKKLYENEIFLQGHFPELPVMPGVLIIESMAQAAGVLIHKSNDDPNNKFILFLTSIEESKFRRPIYPEADIIFYAEIIKAKRNFFKFNCTAKVDDQIMAESIITQAPGKHL